MKPQKPKLDLDRIGRSLRAERRGQVPARSGYFGALQLVAEVQARFQTPEGGGRATDPRWTARRLVPFTPSTLDRLEKLAAPVRERSGTAIHPLQLAALLLEHAVEDATEAVVESLARNEERS
jgi:hypothetical protein